MTGPVVIAWLVLFLLISLHSCDGRTVVVDTDAGWTRTTVSDIAEIAEIVGSIDSTSDLFWQFVDRFCDKVSSCCC